MTLFYFVRHGETAYRLADELKLTGGRRDLVPLTPEGIRQSEITSRDPRLKQAQLIVSSPYTRALQTAAIINGILGLPVVVEHDLHEWIPDRNWGITSGRQALEMSEDYKKCGRAYPDDVQRPWETEAQVRERVIPVLRRYLDYRCVIAVCHEFVIHSVVPASEIPLAGIIEYAWPE